MKTLFSILFGLIIAGGGISLALTANTQESICSEPGHQGYSYDESPTPPLPFDPDDVVLPSGMTDEGKFQQPNGFKCNTSSARCHWVYIPAKGEDPAEWVSCPGDFVKLGPEG